MELAANIIESFWGIPVNGDGQSRYPVIAETIRSNGCRILMEIGVYRGHRSYEMILAALESGPGVEYHGFDLFEDMKQEDIKNEVSVFPLHERQAYSSLKSPGVNVHLHKGYTRDTLPKFLKRDIKPDFVFIDGGHCYETVENDWFYVQKLMHDKTIVLFDDYLSEGEWLGWGSHKIIDALDRNLFGVEMCEPHDIYKMRRPENSIRTTTENRIVKVWKIVH